MPGLGRGDPRVEVPATAWPWSALARLQIPGAARCTAFLVGPRTALTAAHCVYLRRAGHFAPAEAIHLLTGYAGGRFTRHALVASYRIAPGYDPRDRPEAFGADVAVLTLDRDVASPGGVLALDPAPADKVTLAGYSQDRAEIIEADPACRAIGRLADRTGRPVLRHDCAATNGTSGAPLLARTQDGGWRVAGLQVAAVRGARGGLAVPAATLRALVP